MSTGYLSRVVGGRGERGDARPRWRSPFELAPALASGDDPAAPEAAADRLDAPALPAAADTDADVIVPAHDFTAPEARTGQPPRRPGSERATEPTTADRGRANHTVGIARVAVRAATVTSGPEPNEGMAAASTATGSDARREYGPRAIDALVQPARPVAPHLRDGHGRVGQPAEAKQPARAKHTAHVEQTAQMEPPAPAGEALTSTRPGARRAGDARRSLDDVFPVQERDFARHAPGDLRHPWPGTSLGTSDRASEPVERVGRRGGQDLSSRRPSESAGNTSATTVVVTIGRVEIRAAAPPPVVSRPRVGPSPMSLDAYLARREREPR